MGILSKEDLYGAVRLVVGDAREAELDEEDIRQVVVDVMIPPGDPDPYSSGILLIRDVLEGMLDGEVRGTYGGAGGMIVRTLASVLWLGDQASGPRNFENELMGG